MNKKAVYTAITGNYDVLKKPSVTNPGWDYICFTDNAQTQSDFWRVVMMSESALDPIRKARKHKILPHVFLPEYDCSLWIDGNFDIVGDIDSFISDYKTGGSMIGIIHPERDCIYDEVYACIELAKDNTGLMLQQAEEYKAEGFPAHYGLIASGVLYREHGDKKMLKVMEDWWHEVENKSRRDQLSFDYVCWRNQFAYDVCGLMYWANKYFVCASHNAAPAPVAESIAVSLLWLFGEDAKLEYCEKVIDLDNRRFCAAFHKNELRNFKNIKKVFLNPAHIPVKLRLQSKTAVMLNDVSRELVISGGNYDESVGDALTFSKDDPVIQLSLPDNAEIDNVQRFIFTGVIVDAYVT